MAVLPRKQPKKLYPKITDIVADEKEKMARRKAMFDAMLLECKDG